MKKPVTPMITKFFLLGRFPVFLRVRARVHFQESSEILPGDIGVMDIICELSCLDQQVLVTYFGLYKGLLRPIEAY
mgnify:CR=1 FL=1